MARSYQDIMLNALRKENVQATIYLISGFHMRGTVRAFDNYVIVLESEGRQQMIYKHAVSTITPVRPLPEVTALDNEDS